MLDLFIYNSSPIDQVAFHISPGLAAPAPSLLFSQHPFFSAAGPFRPTYLLLLLQYYYATFHLLPLACLKIQG